MLIAHWLTVSYGQEKTVSPLNTFHPSVGGGGTAGLFQMLTEGRLPFPLSSSYTYVSCTRQRVRIEAYLKIETQLLPRPSASACRDQAPAHRAAIGGRKETPNRALLAADRRPDGVGSQVETFRDFGRKSGCRDGGGGGGTNRSSSRTTARGKFPLVCSRRLSDVCSTVGAKKLPPRPKSCKEQQHHGWLNS